MLHAQYCGNVCTVNLKQHIASSFSFRHAGIRHTKLELLAARVDQGPDPG